MRRAGFSYIQPYLAASLLLGEARNMIRGGQSVGRERSSGSNGVLQIARKVAATIGVDFFRAIAKSLAEALAADCVLIGEFVGGQSERCRTLAAWMDGEPATFDYELA